MNDKKVIPFPPRSNVEVVKTYDVGGKYILVDREPVKCDDLLEWGRWMEEGDRHVALTKLENVHVSTVFLGLDHSFSFAGRSRPVLFETMIFGGEHDQEQWRYCTWDEAAAGHAEALALAKEGDRFPSYEWLRAKSRRFMRTFFKRTKE